MKLTRILALCLALLMCLAAFAACNQPDPDEGEEADAETPAITEHLLIDEGITEYVIVRDYKASNAVLAAVNEVVESIKANIGADVIIKECFSDLENEPLDVVTAKEILIGNTNRPESAEAVKGMRSKDYTISMHGEKLVIAGGSSDTADFEAELRSAAADDERIVFTGFVQGRMLEELYSNAYLYVLPSDLEGMPLSLMEAMSYGNCCLTSDIPECSQVTGECGFTFRKSDTEDLRSKLQFLCDNSEEVNKLREASSGYICRKYSWNDVVDRTLKLYFEP